MPKKARSTVDDEDEKTRYRGFGPSSVRRSRTPGRISWPFLDGTRVAYCMGVVSYQGTHYEGKHQPLVEPDFWLAVQRVLAAGDHTRRNSWGRLWSAVIVFESHVT